MEMRYSPDAVRFERMNSQELRDSFAKYTVKTSQHIWDYPRKIKSDINEGLRRVQNGEPGPIKVTTTLQMEIDEVAMEEFHKQMDRLIND